MSVAVSDLARKFSWPIYRQVRCRDAELLSRIAEDCSDTSFVWLEEVDR